MPFRTSVRTVLLIEFLALFFSAYSAKPSNDSVLIKKIIVIKLGLLNYVNPWQPSVDCSVEIPIHRKISLEINGQFLYRPYVSAKPLFFLFGGETLKQIGGKVGFGCRVKFHKSVKADGSDKSIVKYFYLQPELFYKYKAFTELYFITGPGEGADYRNGTKHLFGVALIPGFQFLINKCFVIDVNFGLGVGASLIDINHKYESPATGPGNEEKWIPDLVVPINVRLGFAF